VRLQHDIAEFGEARLNRWFIAEYIEYRAADAVAVKLLPVTVSNTYRDV
jgi:hypothetical protein